MFQFEKIQQHIKAAHTEAEWIVAGIQERWKWLFREHEEQKTIKIKPVPVFEDMFQAAVSLNNPRYGLSQEEIAIHLRNPALREVSREPTSGTEQMNQAMTAALIRRRWASREPVDL